MDLKFLQDLIKYKIKDNLDGQEFVFILEFLESNNVSLESFLSNNTFEENQKIVLSIISSLFSDKNLDNTLKHKYLTKFWFLSNGEYQSNIKDIYKQFDLGREMLINNTCNINLTEILEQAICKNKTDEITVLLNKDPTLKEIVPNIIYGYLNVNLSVIETCEKHGICFDKKIINSIVSSSNIHNTDKFINYLNKFKNEILESDWNKYIYKIIIRKSLDIKSDAISQNPLTLLSHIQNIHKCSLQDFLKHNKKISEDNAILKHFKTQNPQVLEFINQMINCPSIEKLNFNRGLNLICFLFKQLDITQIKTILQNTENHIYKLSSPDIDKFYRNQFFKTIEQQNDIKEFVINDFFHRLESFTQNPNYPLYSEHDKKLFLESLKMNFEGYQKDKFFVISQAAKYPFIRRYVLNHIPDELRDTFKQEVEFAQTFKETQKSKKVTI